MPKSRICNVANVSFNAFRENRIVAKTTGFTEIEKNIDFNTVEFYSKIYNQQMPQSYTADQPTAP